MDLLQKLSPRGPARYGIAIMAVLAGIAARAGLTFLGAHTVFYVAFFPFVVLAAYCGGAGPGLLAVLLFALAGAAWPSAHPEPGDWLAWAVFVAGACFVAAVSARIREARERAVDAESAARHRAAEMGAILDSLRQPVTVFDTEGRPVELNAAARQLFGADASELDPAGYFQRCESLLARRLDGKLLQPEELPSRRALSGNTLRHEEFVYTNEEEQDFIFEVSATPLKMNERIVGAVTVWHDITERKHAEERVKKAKQEAERANAVKDRFLAILSHELRNPLTAVLIAATAMEDDDRLPEDVREDAAMIRRSIAMETRLIEDLLDVTRIARGKLTVQLQPCDVISILRQTVKMCSTELEAKDLRLTLEARHIGRAIRGDPARLQQIIWNLLKNAIKFTPPGGSIDVQAALVDQAPSPPTATTAAGANADKVMIRMSDTGQGIDPQFLPRVFGAFEQDDSSVVQSSAGLGLGLAICKALVNAHGGTIRADSAGKGAGATFTIELPLSDEPLPIQEPQALNFGSDESSSPQRRAKVLLVEDDADTARLVNRLLKADGYDVKLAGDLAGALALAQSCEFDVLVSDLGLPDGTGYDLIQQLTAQCGPVKAIALSGFGADADVARAKASGFVEHLVKPIGIASLEAAINRVAGQAPQVSIGRGS